MKSSLRFGLGVFLMLFSLSTGWAADQAVQDIKGYVTNVDFVRDTFNICPADEGCPVTEENVFVVTPETKMQDIRRFGELRVGDDVEVKGKQLNEVVWIAKELKRL